MGDRISGAGTAVATPSDSRERRRRWNLAVGTAVLLLAAGLRLWALAQTPPGLHHDEAFHLLSARSMVEGAGVPVYITGNQGNEPMYAYLVSMGVRLLGATTWAGRLIASWVGLVSVALTMRLGHAMFPRSKVGLWAGLALASLYWHLTMSRWGSQPILSAAAAAGTLLGLWHGARSGRWRGFALAGASLSFGLWSYVAFRVFPVVPLAAGLALMAARRGPVRRWLTGGLIAVSVALVLYAPLGLYFVQHPEWFFNRYSQVTELRPDNEGSTSSRLLAQTSRVAASLVWPGAGDENWRQNFPGRPAFDLAQALLFGIGAVAALRRWRSPETLALGVWIVVGLAPAVLTEFPPQYGRTVMVTPALALVVGLGAEALWATRRGWLRAGLGVALAASVVITARDYFVRWAQDEHLFVAFDTGLQRLAQTLRQAPAGAALYETPVYRDYPTFEYTLGHEAYDRFRAFNGRACTVLPLMTVRPTEYGIIVAEDQRTLPALMAAFPGGGLRRQTDFNGVDYTAIYDIPAGQTAKVAGDGVEAEFGGLIRLRASELDDREVRGGETLQVALTWELVKATGAQLTMFVHVIGPPQADGSVVYAQRDSGPCDNSYPTWQWQPGELMIDHVSVPLPADLAPGRYEVTVGWYDSLTQVQWPETSASPDRDMSYQIATLVIETP